MRARGTRGRVLGGRRPVAVACVALALTPLSVAPAHAQVDTADVGPPPVDTALRPSSVAPVPPTAAVLARPCTAASTGPAGSAPTSPITNAPWAQVQLGYERVWKFGTGAGQRVAVIDTGVNPHPRLAVIAGGDYVDRAGNGISDCDAHGSIVASIIAAKPSLADPTGYAGVAPDAQILSIRQYSARYQQAGPPPGGAPVLGYGNVATLGAAVVWAADNGATVINISEVACGPAGVPLPQDGTLGAALQYAVDVRDVVVVAAAGNVVAGTECGTQNDPSGVPPTVSTVASPAWYSDLVLTVGSVESDGSPSSFSLAGPWVDVAAPGSQIVALNPVAGPPLIDLLVEPGGVAPIQGTSFAAPYVAGTVALVRQRFPGLTARQVMARITATAQAPPQGWNPRVGYGVLDPVAAVTDVLPAAVAPQPVSTASTRLAPLPQAPVPDAMPRRVAMLGSAAVLGAALMVFAMLDAVRRARRQTADPP